MRSVHGTEGVVIGCGQIGLVVHVRVVVGRVVARHQVLEHLRRVRGVGGVRRRRVDGRVRCVVRRVDTGAYGRMVVRRWLPVADLLVMVVVVQMAGFLLEQTQLVVVEKVVCGQFAAVVVGCVGCTVNVWTRECVNNGHP